MREKLLGLLLGGQGIRPAEKICNISYSWRLRFDKGAQKVKLRAFLDRHGSSNGTSFLLTGLCVNPITTFTPTTHHIFTTTTTRCITLLSLFPRFCTLPNKKSVRCSLCIQYRSSKHSPHHQPTAMQNASPTRSTLHCFPELFHFSGTGRNAGS